MTRLPDPGGDSGIWGEILNEFLSVEHNSDGTLKASGSLAEKANASLIITAGTGLSGGGDLTTNRTLAVTDDTTTQRVRVSDSGTLIGTRQEINLIGGSGVALTTADNAGSNRVDVTITSTQTEPSTPLASDQNLIAWAFDPVHAVSLTGTANGTMSLIRVIIRETTTLTNGIYAVVNAGGSLTAGQNFISLYNSSGTRVAISADQTTNMGTSNNIVTAPWTTPYVAAAGNYWIALLTNGSTSPDFARAGANAISNLASVGLTTSTRRFGTFGSGLTAPPASFSTASIGAVTNGLFWAGVS